MDTNDKAEILTFRWIEIFNYQDKVVMYDKNSGTDITKLSAKFLSVQNFKNSYDKKYFYSYVLPELINQFHDFANQTQIFLSKEILKKKKTTNIPEG